MHTRRVDEHDLSFGIVANAGNAIARGLRLVGNDGELLADQTVEEGGLAGVGPADQRDEPALHPAGSAARRLRHQPAHADAIDAPPFGLEHLDRQAVDLEGLANGRHAADVREQIPAHGLVALALDVESSTALRARARACGR